MSENQKFILILTAIAVFVFALFQATNASAYTINSTRILTLDQPTLQKGFTIKSLDDNFWLPIFPNQYQTPITVKIEHINSETPIPENKTAISSHYIYDLKLPVSGILSKKATLAVKYTTSTDEEKAIYFYDRSKEQWRALTTKVDSERKIAIAETIFPFAEIVVLENKTATTAPNVSSIPENIPRSFSDQLTAQSAIVADLDGNIIFEKNADQVRPIASLTKLITAQVFVENNPGWDKKVTIIESDNVGGASIPLEPGDLISVKNLFNATLVGSKNNATRALMRSTGMTEDQFVAKMNALVQQWGLTNTSFVEPTGLSEYNVSTAREMLEIFKRTFNKFDFLQATTTYWSEITYKRGNEVRSYWCQNTNKLLLRDLYITGGKTGYTTEAGYNLVTRARLTKNSSQELIALVLGAKISQNYEEVDLLLHKFLNK